MTTVFSPKMPGCHHRVELNGIRIHYTVAGAGDPLVLLHGFPMTSYYWRRIIPSLAQHFTVIVPDLRGCGDSDRPSAGYDKRTVAEDIHRLVQHRELGPINLVSHDVGMMVAYAYASRYPAEVKRLVLTEAALAGFGLEALFDADKNPRMFHLPLFEAPNGLAEALITGREPLFVAHMMRQQAYDTTALDHDALEEYSRHLAAPGALHGGIEYFRAHRIDKIHNLEHASAKLPMPVLTIGGTASFGVNLESEIRPLAQNLRSAMIDECGHYLAEEQPEKLTELLLNFLLQLA
ncbi:alpha/beta fold hydrolase [uncultured Caballeronia sp.]|uniref:alpha/beta fold hydrolase n=1 Tax=uncultured Caballeronia sp. TaxID=1827198 RepID=UPI0035C98876